MSYSETALDIVASNKRVMPLVPVTVPVNAKVSDKFTPSACTLVKAIYLPHA